MNAAHTEPSPPPLIEQVVVLTPSGVDALTDSNNPRECDLCRRPLAHGDAYHRVTIGMDEAPSHIGASLAHESTVEDVSELIVCAACAPAVAAPVEQLLTAIWALRRPDPLDESEDEPTVQTERSP